VLFFTNFVILLKESSFAKEKEAAKAAQLIKAISHAKTSNFLKPDGSNIEFLEYKWDKRKSTAGTDSLLFSSDSMVFGSDSVFYFLNIIKFINFILTA
jgi:hypothetical protein